jgi:predicted metal-dependent hydrolase
MNQKFPYTLRISEKAKHVRFQVSVEKGLEIVVPKRFSTSRVPSLVQKNSRWIERAFRKAESLRGPMDLGLDWVLPREISLTALNLTWKVVPCRDDMKSVMVSEAPSATLLVHGSTNDAVACQAALKAWLTRAAKEHLIPWLQRVSGETGLRYSSASIRQQQTRWGSCSSRNVISLNARLLLLPAELVTYVLVHELCHTKQLNHSPKFWRLVEFHFGDYRRADRELRESGQYMPGWLTAACEARSPSI